MQLISKFNIGIRFLLCAIDIFSKHAWVIPLKDKKRTNIANAFRKGLLIFSVNTHGLFLRKIKKELTLLMLFEKV